MGIRPHKSIGWGVTVKGSQLNKNAVDEFLNLEGLSYSGLIDYIVEKDLMKIERERSWVSKEKFSQFDDSRKLFNYAEVLFEDYDSEEDFDEGDLTILFYPNVLSPLVIYKDHAGKGDVEGYKSGDNAFVYAEIEQFFPESMSNLSTVSYNFKTPPFPSEYSVIEKKEFKSVDDFVSLRGDARIQEIKRCLLNIDLEFIEYAALSVGFESVDEVGEAFSLAPPEDVFAFAQYSGIFKNESVPFELKPTVVYYWT